MLSVFKVFFIILTVTSSSWVHALCITSIPTSTPNSSFIVHENGTVTHKNTNLTWKRCGEGQELEGNTCINLPTNFSSWVYVLPYITEHNLQGGYAGNSDWRLPNIKELNSIVDDSCASPAINLSIFPNTPSSLFFSSSPSAYSSSLEAVFLMDFDDGVLQHSGGGLAKYVRLVRGGN